MLSLGILDFLSSEGHIFSLASNSLEVNSHFLERPRKAFKISPTKPPLDPSINSKTSTPMSPPPKPFNQSIKYISFENLAGFSNPEIKIKVSDSFPNFLSYIYLSISLSLIHCCVFWGFWLIALWYNFDNVNIEWLRKMLCWWRWNQWRVLCYDFLQVLLLIGWDVELLARN